MRKQFFGHILGLALSVSLVLSGCGSSDSGPPPGGGTGTSSTSSTSTTTTGGTTGIATTAGTGGGSTASGNSTSTTSTSSTSTTTTTTTGGGFAGDVEPTQLYPASTGVDPSQQITNPTQYARIGDRIFFLDGFDTGAGNGRLLSFDLNAALNSPVVGQPTFQRLRQPGNPGQRFDEFFNPFGIIAGPDNALYVSTGFGIQSAGAIIRISNINTTGTQANFTEIATDAGFLVNPTFMTIANVDGANYIYWSEYSAMASSGRVRRARTDGNGSTQTVVTGLNFPAGLAHDGTNLMICENEGPPFGRVLRTPLAMASDEAPRGPGMPSVVAIETNIERPFDVVYDGANGFFIAAGNTINFPAASLPLPMGPGNGAVYYVAGSSTTAETVSSGLTQVSGIDAAVLPGGEVGLVFTESIASFGRVLRRVVDVNSISDQAPEQLDTGLFYPLSVGIEDAGRPVFLNITGYAAGQANGLIKAYYP